MIVRRQLPHDRLVQGARAAAGVVVLATGGGLALQALSGASPTLGPAALALAVGLFAIVVVRVVVRMGVLLSATGILFGVGTLAAGTLDYGATHGTVPRAPQLVAYALLWLTGLGISAWALFILWFPDARFPGPGWRRYWVAGSAVAVGFTVASWLLAPGTIYTLFAGTRIPTGIAGPLATEAWRPVVETPFMLLFPLGALGGPALRFRRSTAVARRQIGLLFVAAALSVVVQLAGLLLEQVVGGRFLVSATTVVAQPLPAIAAALAIVRYRLWEIDVVVSRALVYGVLWAGLSALLLVPPLAAGLLVGGRGALTAVGIALLVTAIFQPTRRRLERLAERLVYRHRHRPYALLTSFWEKLRTATLEKLGPLLAEAVQSGLGVRWAGVWLYAGDRRGGSLRRLGGAGAEPGPPVVVPAAVAEALLGSPGLVLADDFPSLGPEPPAAVVPLVAADELVGVLACGARPGDKLGAADFELLELLARESALRLRNLRLEAQLRERLGQIEAQAAELQRSRRRLVAAQDEERRRIERNLHDGVQQQLVSLAARLKRVSGGDPVLADLAAEAEQTVFALQELARGIFPSVLADQGLPAALRTQAARLPLAVRVEVDPTLAGRRLDPELEAALYFVALEALTNAQKHAPDAAVGVWLRADGPDVALEVADDGPGFAGRPRCGSGLQNMTDRVAAAGGAFSLDSAPGRGTRVTARVPAGPPLLQADSRR